MFTDRSTSFKKKIKNKRRKSSTNTYHGFNKIFLFTPHFTETETRDFDYHDILVRRQQIMPNERRAEKVKPITQIIND